MELQYRPRFCLLWASGFHLCAPLLPRSKLFYGPGGQRRGQFLQTPDRFLQPNDCSNSPISVGVRHYPNCRGLHAFYRRILNSPSIHISLQLITTRVQLRRMWHECDRWTAQPVDDCDGCGPTLNEYEHTPSHHNRRQFFEYVQHVLRTLRLSGRISAGTIAATDQFRGEWERGDSFFIKCAAALRAGANNNMGRKSSWRWTNHSHINKRTRTTHYNIILLIAWWE